MRVLILHSHTFPPATATGSRMEKYARGLRESDAEPFIFAISRRPEERVEGGWRRTPAGIPYQVALVRRRGRWDTYGALRQTRDAFLSALRELGPWDAAIVQGQNSYCAAPVAELCRRQGTRCVVECNEWLAWQGHKGWFLSPFFWMKERFRRVTLRQVSGAIAISRLWEEHLRGMGVPVIRIPALGEAESQATGPPPGRGPFTICYAGQLSPRDLPLTMLEALRRALRAGLDCRLWFVGSLGLFSIGRRALESAQRDGLLRERVESTGWISREEYRARLAGAHCLVLFREDSREARACFPTRLPEYLLTGRPVVTSAVGDPALYLQHQVSAWLVPPGDQPEAIAEAYLKLSRDPQLAALIGSKGRETALREFSYRRYGAPLLEFLRGLKR
jgi:glycosyltransferase involved in cell wall biosynthesis